MEGTCHFLQATGRTHNRMLAVGRAPWSSFSWAEAGGDFRGGRPSPTSADLRSMNFDFTPEQIAIQAAAQRYATERLAPGFAARDGERRMDPALVREMGELGLIACSLAEEHGALNADNVTAGLVIEAISSADLSMSYVQLLGSLNGDIIQNHASEAVAKHWVPRIVSGDALVALGLTEPGGGSDAANLKLRAARSGNGFVLNGEKTSISLAEQADAIIVFARTGQPQDKARGVSAFMVPLDEPGITRSGWEDLGSSVVGRGSVFFDDVFVPADQMLGAEGQGFIQVMQGFDYSRALIGLQCIAAARVSLAETWEYTRGRKSFDAPLASYQGVTFPLAEFDTQLEAARLLCYKTLWMRDTGQPHTAEAAMCKWWAPKLAFDAINQCLLTHGHAGYSKDLPYQQRMRDVLGLQIGDGTAQIMKLVIARERVGRVALQYA